MCRESTAGQNVALAQSWSDKEEADCGAKGLKLRSPGEIGLAQDRCCLQLGWRVQTDLVNVDAELLWVRGAGFSRMKFRWR